MQKCNAKIFRRARDSTKRPKIDASSALDTVKTMIMKD